ncbi:hypothetical protein BDK51DRAFT_49143 [Blyttiomyces helicus]|uniref:ABC transmembrane type-1 domain-containing protein n=1 Tax=Blyttiomyces helicus TaxID=388810 RepID=A0A4V1IQW9_9FUNG|nr:hypothetical protein BDK51DRAFT_49143 [Blyttiomyces helicus]|eukprot:RKO88017.1 hypothetical protein BDK51DRAFT_49143 [Blyttiomyces helicus]
MINVDANTMAEFARGSNLIWSAPVQIAVTLALLNKLIGRGTWAGFGFVLFSFFIQAFIMPIAVKAQKGVMEGGDARLKAVRELFQGIRVIKLRAWEDVFLEKLTALRQVQVTALKTFYFAAMVFLSLTQLTPVVSEWT